jgi:MtN3 and saliva related transmembrane protein
MWVVIEFIFGLALFVNALLFVPQIIQLLRTKNADGLSLITFAGFNLIQLFTVLHGYLHHDYLLMVGNLMSLLTCGIVACLIVKYKK